MAPRPYSERVTEPFDLTRLSQEVPNFPIPVEDEIPSPGTPSSNGSPSPPLLRLAFEPRPLIQIASGEDGVPYDHTLPDFIRQVTGQPTLNEIQSMTLRVFTEASSLQQMTLHTPNLRELNLEGSALTSLRDIGSELSHLHILRVSRCHLISLDGTLGLINLRELHASGNAISSAAPCSHLSHLRLLDISRNRLQDARSLSFLTRCRNLRSLRVAGNPIRNQQILRDFVHSTLPTLEYLDDIPLLNQALTDQERDGRENIDEQIHNSPRVFERDESTSTSDSSRVSSASSSVGVNTTDEASANNDQTSANVSSKNDSGLEHSDASVSSLTSGQIVCGNLVAIRRRQMEGQAQPRSETLTRSNSDVLEASRRWRAAYHRFRELNSRRWEEDAAQDEENEEKPSN